MSYLIVPCLMGLQITTVYEYLDERFDLRTGIFGASLLTLLRTTWMGMVIFTVP